MQIRSPQWSMGRIHSVVAFDIRKVKYKETMSKNPLKDLRMVWGYIQINGQLAFKRRLLLRDRGCRSGKLYKHNDWAGWKIDHKSQRTCLKISIHTKLQTSNGSCLFVKVLFLVTSLRAANKDYCWQNARKPLLYS